MKESSSKSRNLNSSSFLSIAKKKKENEKTNKSNKESNKNKKKNEHQKEKAKAQKIPQIFKEKNKKRKNDSKTFNEMLNKLKPKDRFKYLIEEEINNLSFLDALHMDFRTFGQYYWSLLKAKQLIIFTFINNKDNNIRVVKICLFILSFTIYFTINTFFFNDESIHKIYKNKGEFNIPAQLMQIAISSTISVVLNMIIKYFSLSQKHILKIKDIKVKRAKIESKDIYKSLRIKLNMFIVVGFLILLFSWYYLTIFCCIYKNSQIHLIKSVGISFIISMFYPVAISLIAAILRIISLGDKKKKKIILYEISKLLSFI